MSNPWPEVPLAEIAKPVARTVAVVPGQDYRTIGVKWWGQGAYERETIDGSRTAAKTLSIVRKGDLIINKIWVRHGSTAVAGKDVDGCAASGEFPTFELNPGRVVSQWIHWHTKTRGFWSKCDALSQGTSGKNRIKPDLFLTIPVPLPPVEEQRRVVARIEELAAQIHETNTLRHQAVEETDALLSSRASALFNEAEAQFQREPLVETCSFEGGSQPPKSTFRYTPAPGYVRFLQIRDFSSDNHLTYIPASHRNSMVEPHEVLIGRYGASLGKILRGKSGAYNVAMCKAVPKRADLDLDFLAHSLRYGSFQQRLLEISRSAQAGFNKADIREVWIAVPPLPEQRRIVADLDVLQAEVDILKRLQAETAAELDALLPAILDRAFRGKL